MSNKRFTKPPYQGQKGKCFWCGTEELPPGRRSWCSQKCVDAYLMVSSSDHIRKKVFERDKGICALCGCDSRKEYAAWCEQKAEITRLFRRLIGNYKCPMTGKWQYISEYGKEATAFKKYLHEKYAPGNWTSGRRSAWDADHIIPVAEGGGECDLSNYRTLCHPCHKQVTADLAARLAAKRKGLPWPPQPDPQLSLI